MTWAVVIVGGEEVSISNVTNVMNQVRTGFDSRIWSNFTTAERVPNVSLGVPRVSLVPA